MERPGGKQRYEDKSPCTLTIRFASSQLVGFIASPNPQIRAVAIESLVPYSAAEPNIFKTEELTPVKHLKFLIRDHHKIAEHALTILINLTGDQQVLESVATDDHFLDAAFAKIVVSVSCCQ